MTRLQSKAGFVTGATSGIGLAAAQAFIRNGAMVGITGRDRGRVESATSMLGPMCSGFVADAGDDERMGKALRAMAERLEGLDFVFANAGHYVHSAWAKLPGQAWTSSSA